ncbi:MAG: TonB family protein [Bacteroidia bacterium]|nr:TonB family protein [Bacteroidia bacterium]
MSALIIYAVKAGLYLSAFYLVYFLFLSRDTSYGRNRAYIIIAGLLSVFMPLITLYTSRPLEIQYLGKMLTEVFITATAEKSFSSGVWFKDAGTTELIFTIYIIGAAIVVLKLVADLLNLLLLILRHKKDDSRIIRFHSFNTSGFSAMGYIFINSKLNSEESDEIIRHEKNHLRMNHFIDIIFIGLIKAFQWFNPVIYFFDRSLRAIHEYQADRECLNSGIPVVSYQELLLNQVFRTKAFNLTNSFSNPSLVRKRMLMMTKKRSSALAAIKLIAVIPVAGFLSLAVSAYRDIPFTEQKTDSAAGTSQLQVVYGENAYPGSSEEHKTVPYVQVEQMPLFPGGDVELLKYLAANTRYPEKAKENGIQGRVIVRFCVNENGSVDRISILKGVDPELDAEAVRVVGTLPAFMPGRQGGIAVPTWYMVPLTFALR